MTALNLIRRPWTIRDLLDAIRFPRRKATVLPAVWVDELMQKRFGTLIVCQSCAVKYRDGLRRWAYAPHGNMRCQGNACDFCQTVPNDGTPLWFKEERRYPTSTDIARQVHHSAARYFRDTHRAHPPRSARPVPRGAVVNFAGHPIS